MNNEPIDEKAIFKVACRIDSAEARTDYLNQICRDKPELLVRVDRLLRMSEEDSGFLESPAAAFANTVTPAPLTEKAGMVVGPYKLREQIGEGGFGVVYVAEQTKPIRRKVALKIIKPGMDSKEIIARFEAERQALALMDHPNIAKVLDAGTTSRSSEVGSREDESDLRIPTSDLAAQRPYFVMELVRGLPITEFCDGEKLTTEQRLRLFTDVCRAVQHAHQKGVIHRDIKPTNVLVTLHDGKPVPKVIDFGVAKALSQQLTEHTLYTAMGQMVGTPMYMSPEQAEMSGLDVDTRSDVYSLGVLLYELLTGSTPFDKQTLKEAGLDGMRRIIRETEPVKPSARISTLEDDHGATISDKRRVDTRKLEQALRGDLDWVVMKSLEKDRNRRYESASAFAADVDNYLQDEPVSASPPSALYRFRKYARRHRQAVIASAALTLVVLVVMGAAGWIARDRAAQRTVLLNQVTAALDDVETLMIEGRPRAALSAAERACDLVARSEADPALLASVHARQQDIQMILRLEQIRLEGAAIESFDVFRTVPLYKEAFREYGIPLDGTSPEEVASRVRNRPPVIREALVASISDLTHLIGDRAGVLPNRQDREAHPERVDPTIKPEWRRLLRILRAIDDNAWRQEFWDAIERDDRAALMHLAANDDLNELPPGNVVLLTRYLADAVAVDILRQAQKQHPGDFWINHKLAIRLMKLGHVDEAIRYFQVAVAIRPDSPGAHLNLGVALAKDGDGEAAIAEHRRAIELQPDDPVAYSNIGLVLQRLGRRDEAVVEFRKAIELQPNFVNSYRSLGRVLDNEGRHTEAVAVYRQGLEHHPDDPLLHKSLGQALSNAGDLQGSIAAYREAVRCDDGKMTYQGSLATALEKAGEFDEAIAWWTIALSHPDSNLDLDAAKQHLAGLMVRNGPFEGGTDLWNSAAEIYIDALNEGADANSKLVPGPWTTVSEDEKLFDEITHLMSDDDRLWEARGRAFALEENWDAAASDYAEALRLVNDSNRSVWWGREAELADRIVQTPELFQRVRALRPQDDRLSVAHVHELAINGDFEIAVDELVEVTGRYPDEHWNWFHLAPLQLQAHDMDEYRLTCEVLIERFLEWNAGATRVLSAIPCLLTPDVTRERLRQIHSALEPVISGELPPARGFARWQNIAVGLLAYRSNEFDEARTWLEKNHDNLPSAYEASQIVLAMMEYREGNIDRGRDTLRNVIAILDTTRQQRWSMFSRATVDILRREAAELMQIDDPADSADADRPAEASSIPNNE